jgi:hypothetical protein
MVDHRRDASSRTTRGVESKTRGASVEDAPQPIRAALVQDRVARTTFGRRRRPCGRKFFDDDLNESLNVWSLHHSRSRIFASRLM